MDQLSNADHTTQFSHHFGNFQIVAQNMHAGKERQMFHDLAIFGHRVRHRHTVCQMGQFIILDTMARRNMDKACTLFRGDIISVKQRNIMIIAMFGQRVRGNGANAISARQAMKGSMLGNANRSADFFQQSLCQNNHITNNCM